jgi:hypothetical protein
MMQGFCCALNYTCEAQSSAQEVCCRSRIRAILTACNHGFVEARKPFNPSAAATGAVGSKGPFYYKVAMHMYSSQKMYKQPGLNEEYCMNRECILKLGSPNSVCQVLAKEV